MIESDYLTELYNRQIQQYKEAMTAQMESKLTTGQWIMRPFGGYEGISVCGPLGMMGAFPGRVVCPCCGK